MLIVVLEYATGLLLNKQLGLAVWDYADQPLNLDGQICLSHSLVFAFVLAPFCFWVDAVTQWAVYDAAWPGGLWRFYRFFARQGDA